MLARAVHRPRTRSRALPLVASSWASLPRPRALVRPYARSPEFTAPDEPLYSTPPPPPGGGAAAGQLPPTALPQDDYAPPVLSIGLTFRRVFRYAVYASVAIVLTVGTGFAGTHWWIEHVRLAPPALARAGPDADPDEWLDERDGWTGLHTQARGGTDPRLGFSARMALRAAYFAQTSGTGNPANPAADAATTTHVANPDAAFAVTRPGAPGGRLISSEDGLAALGAQVNDSSWLQSELYLVNALRLARERGIALVDSPEWEAHVDHGGVDRAAVELEERLASIRELIGGRPRLEAARDAWERIYYALAASPTTDPARADERAWEQREKVKAARKLAEVSARIAELWREGSDERRAENRRAEGWFVGGLVPVLAASEGQSLEGDALHNLLPEQTAKSASPKSSWFAFWSRRQPTASAAPLTPELAHLVALVPAAPSAPLSPATHRSILSSLVSLETFLARRRDDPSPSSRLPPTLPAAQAVQSAALSYARALLARCDPLTSVAHLASSTPSLPSPASLSRALSTLFYTTRTAALETHHAECALAHASSSSSASSRPPSSTVTTSLAAIRHALTDAQLVVDAAAALEARLEATRRDVLGIGRESDEERAFGAPLRRVRRDAERVVEMAERLERVVAGMGGAKR